jgi:DNA-binding transcriptional regulator YdaS (Cro superfamily)
MNLSEFFEHSKMSQRDFAARVNVTEASVSLWRSGKRTPSLNKAVIIERFTDGLVTCKDLIVNSIPPAGE